MIFTNNEGRYYEIKPINRWLLLLKAEKLTGKEYTKPEPPTYLHTYRDPMGGERHELELITQVMVDSEQASAEDKALWASYQAKIERYNTKLSAHVNTLTLTQAISDPVSEAFLSELNEQGLTDSMSDDEIKLMWIVSEVAPSQDEQSRLRDIFESINGVKSDDVKKVADTFRPENVQG